MLRSDEEEAGTLVMDLTADKDESINKDIECVTPRTGSVLEQKDGAEEFVEGGFRGWLNVLGAFLTTFISFGFSNGWAILQNYYAKSKYPDRTPSEIAWIGSSQIFFMFVMGSVSGPLYDKGYFRSLLITGSALHVFSSFMTAICKEYWQTLLSQGIASGIGMGLIFVPTVSVLAQNFLKKRALVMGIAVTGSSLGGVIFPIFMGRMLDRYPFPTAYRNVTYLMTAVALFINLTVTSKPITPRPAAAGAKPNPFSFLKERRYSLAVAGSFFIALGIFVPLFYFTVFTESKGLPKVISQYGISIINAASIFGRTIPNYVADSVGPFNVMVPMFFGTGVLVWAMLGATNVAGAVIFAILYGFFSGAYVSLVNPLFASTAKSPDEIGQRIGFAITFIGFAALAGTPIAGALLVKTPNFIAPIAFAGGCLAVGSVLYLLARIEQAKVKGVRRV